jgi:hypothetical protein
MQQETVLRLQGAFELSALVLYFGGYFGEAPGIMYLGGAMLVIDIATTIWLRVLSPRLSRDTGRSVEPLLHPMVPGGLLGLRHLHPSGLAQLRSQAPFSGEGPQGLSGTGAIEPSLFNSGPPSAEPPLTEFLQQGQLFFDIKRFRRQGRGSRPIPLLEEFTHVPGQRIHDPGNGIQGGPRFGSDQDIVLVEPCGTASGMVHGPEQLPGPSVVDFQMQGNSSGPLSSRDVQIGYGSGDDEIRLSVSRGSSPLASRKVVLRKTRSPDHRWTRSRVTADSTAAGVFICWSRVKGRTSADRGREAGVPGASQTATRSLRTLGSRYRVCCPICGSREAQPRENSRVERRTRWRGRMRDLVTR